MNNLLERLNKYAQLLVKNDIVLQEVYGKLKDIPNLNKGGCLYAASAVWIYLEKNKLLDKDIRLVQIAYNETDNSIPHNKLFLKGVNLQAEAGFHFVLSSDRGITLYDSDGLYELKQGYKKLIITRSKTKDFIESSLRNKKSWNPTFSRINNKKKIEELLEIELPDY